MDKGLLVSYLLEIAIAIGCIFISVPMWNKLNIDKYENVAKSYENFGVRVTDANALAIDN